LRIEPPHGALDQNRRHGRNQSTGRVSDHDRLRTSQNKESGASDAT
jgi:hypothetical protein